MDTSTVTREAQVTLRLALLLNAGFSLLTGALLAVQPSRVAAWLGVSIDGWLRVLGFALLGHAVALVWAAGNGRRERWARLNLAMIAPYPLALIVIIATGLVDRPLGQGLVLADAAIVASIAVVHALGLRIARPVTHAQLA